MTRLKKRHRRRNARKRNQTHGKSIYMVAEVTIKRRPTAEELSKLTVPVLRDRCKDEGHAVTTKTKKADLIDLLVNG